MTAHPRLGAIAVLVRDGRVLLAKRKKNPDAGLWGFPGGHVELGETALDAATREMSEETGVQVRALEYLTNVDVIRREASGAVSFHYLLTAVLCEYVTGTPKPADDVSDARWFDVNEIANGALPMSDRVIPVMQMAIQRRADRLEKAETISAKR